METQIVIPDEKVGIIEAAQKVFGASFGERIVRLLEQELRHASAPETITIAHGIEYGYTFNGRWIVGTAERAEMFYFEDGLPAWVDPQLQGYSLAVTDRGQLVVVRHRLERSFFTVNVAKLFVRLCCADTLL